ncbi:MAG: hypothetical protein EAZ89_18225, partial [Bacteroidetes bacterium]
FGKEPTLQAAHFRLLDFVSSTLMIQKGCLKMRLNINLKLIFDKGKQGKRQEFEKLKLTIEY